MSGIPRKVRGGEEGGRKGVASKETGGWSVSGRMCGLRGRGWSGWEDGIIRAVEGKSRGGGGEEGEGEGCIPIPFQQLWTGTAWPAIMASREIFDLKYGNVLVTAS